MAQISLAPQFSYVKLDAAALDQLLRGPNGPVYRHLLTQADKVKDEAKRLVGVSKPDPVPRSNPHRPGTLRDRIVKRVAASSGREPTVQVGADVPYALWHHEGIPGGVIITPKRSKFLVFYWEAGPRGPGVYYARQVRQGAIEPNRFLVDALAVVR